MELKRGPDVERFLKSPDRGVRVALIYGPDAGKVRELAGRLAAVATERPDDPFDVALMSDGDLDGEGASLEGELSAQSMMGGRRLVRLRIAAEKLEKSVADALVSHAQGRFNPDAFLLIEAGNLGRRSPLRAAAEKAPASVLIPCYEDEVRDLEPLVRDALARDNVALTREALALFVARLPKERAVVRQEIERLALFLGPGSGLTASPADLDAFLGVEPEASLADAASDAFGGRLAEAQAGLRRAAQEGEAGPAAVRALGIHLGRLRRTLTLTANGAGAQEAAKASGVFWKNEREFLRQVRAWSIPELERLQSQVLDADRACKSAGAPDHLIAERLALTIAGRAKRLGL